MLYYHVSAHYLSSPTHHPQTSQHTQTPRHRVSPFPFPPFITPTLRPTKVSFPSRSCAMKPARFSTFFKYLSESQRISTNGPKRLSVASPTTISYVLRTEERIRVLSLASERTAMITWCLWASKAGVRRQPSLPVAPRRRTFIVMCCRMLKDRSLMSNGNE